MIEHINNRCNQWARWRMLRGDNGLGYPRQCNYTKLVPIHASRDPGRDEACWEIEQAYHALPSDERNLKGIIDKFYLGRGTIDQRARDLGIHRDTMYARLHQAHVKIMEWLNDEAAGLHDKRAKIACNAPTVSV